MSYSAREVMNCLSLREFTALTNLIDEFGPKIVIAGHGNGATAAGDLKAKKFNVERVVRRKQSIEVVVSFAHGDIREVEIPIDGGIGGRRMTYVGKDFKEAA
jgi:hypothetical protein